MNKEAKEVKMSAIGTETKWVHLFSRQPLSAFGKLAVSALLGSAVASGILTFLVGYPVALLILTAALLVVTGFAMTGFRWIPPLVALLNGIFLYEAVTQPFVSEHLSNPKADGFAPFVLDVLIIACEFVAFGTALGATLQNDRQGSQEAPHWLPSALTGVAGIVFGAVLIAAMAQPAAVTASGTLFTNGVPTVHMDAGSFLSTSVTIPKGSKLLQVDDVPVLHILGNGSWENGVPKPAKELGAPNMSNVQVNDSSVEAGPFTTAGTYHIYCEVHPGMNLTIIVQ